ncbi:MAG: multicopper oxidase domain-containing protein, partial [Nitrospirota bacterium]
MMKRQSPQLMAIAGAMALAIAGLMGLPSAASAKTHDIKMTALEVEIVTEGTGEKYRAWTFNGQMPGPAVRVTEGDTVNFTLENPKTNVYQHSMDFHAAEIDFLKNYRAI